MQKLTADQHAKQVARRAAELARELLDLMQGESGAFHLVSTDSCGNPGIVIVCTHREVAERLYAVAMMSIQPEDDHVEMRLKSPLPTRQ